VQLSTLKIEQGGERLDKALASYPEFGTRARVVYLLERELLKVNSRTVKPSYILREGDIITYQLPPPTTSEIKPLDLKLDILFEDEDLIVINKPSGLVVHPAAGHQDDTLVNALKYHTKDLSMKFGEDRPGIVHRLDRDTSGILVVAKNDRSHEFLAAQFKDKSAHRVYFALTYGEFQKRHGQIKSYLARHPSDRKRFASLLDHNKKPLREPDPTITQGKWAVTNYEVVSSTRLFSYVKLQLETGRTHQIRVHLSEMGHPIVGDLTYGSNKRGRSLPEPTKTTVDSLKRFLLHAGELGFIHPTNRQPLHFQAPWPEDMKLLIAELGIPI
jgi:23S rRNA pseudouridine1911/1915/1917 synthase